MSNGAISTILTGGLGAMVGSVGTALIQILGKKSEIRATAAQLVTKGAADLTTVSVELVNRLDAENKQFRHGFVLVAEVIEGILDEDEGLSESSRKKLRELNKAIFSLFAEEQNGNT